MFTFAEKQTSLDQVPEGFRGLYSPVEGGEGFVIHEDFKTHVSGLKNGLEKERKSIKTIKDQLETWTALGFDTPDAAKQKLAELEEAAKAGDTKAAALWEKAKKEIQDGHVKVLATKDGEVAAMTKTLHKHLVETAAVKAIADAKGKVKALLPHITAAVRVVKDGENYVVRVMDGDGDARVNGRGEPLTIEEFVTELKSSEDFSPLFEASTSTGGGKKPGSSKPGGAPANADQVSGVDRINKGLASGALSKTRAA